MISSADLAEILEHRTGLKLEAIGGERSMALAMRRCAEAAGFASLAEWRQAAVRTAGLWDEFVHSIIVPETFLFRYPESFLALADWVRAPARNQARLRILCLPCSTGEEAYSIAITLAEAGLAVNQFSILAVDIDARSIVQAERGEYRRATSLRAASHPLAGNYWSEKSAGALVMDPAIRQPITFRARNLWELSRDDGPFDLIFCRNLLIYFSEANQAAALAKLGQLLHPDGLLFLGPAEVPVAGKFGWHSADYPMAFACRRGSVPSRNRPAPASRPVKRPPIPVPLPEKPRTRATPPVGPASRPLADIRAMADRGDLGSAEKILEDYLRAVPADADALVLAGILGESSGKNEFAEDCFRRAIYLNPDHTEAMAHLALMLEAQGRLGASRKLRERAERISVR